MPRLRTCIINFRWDILPTGTFTLICCWILIVFSIGRKNLVDCDASFIQVESVILQPLPHGVRNDDLLQMDLQSRRNLCKDALKEMKEMKDSVYPPEIRNSFYVSTAHMYKFDDKDLLAIQCPTTPTMYVSRDPGKSSVIRTVKYPRIDTYEFNFEAVERASQESPRDVSSGLKKISHHLYTFELDERWHLCHRAQKMIRFKFEINGMVEQPHYHQFQYYTNWKEVYLSIRCSTSPPIYLRTDHSESSRPNVITIVLVGYSSTLERSQLTPVENVDHIPSPP